MTDQAKPSLPPSAWISGLELALKLIGLVETILPALLVAWNDQLRAQVAAGKQRQVLLEAQLKGELDAKRVGDETMGLGRRALLERAVRGARAGAAARAAPVSVPAGG